MSDPENRPGAEAAAAPAREGSVLKGVLIGFALQLLLVFMPVLAVGIAVVQLVYIVPMALWFKRKGERATVKGLVIAASVVALLNAACWGFVLSGGVRIGG